ncbi:MAG: PIN domain-containing protein [Nanoarchaeota archaeon]
MKLVIDTNTLISALVKSGETRNFIINRNTDFELISPAYILSEINKYKDEICRKAVMNEEQFYLLLDILFSYIKIINPNFYSEHLKYADELIGPIDIKDVPFLACALAFNCPIWSNDNHFQKQKIVKIFKNKDILNY